MEPLNTKTFKDLDQMLSDIADKFFFAKKIKDNPETVMLAETSLDDGFPDAFISKVERAYESLDDGEKNLINNEFFYQSYNQWWETIYSKASFYRYKKMAMEKFLGAFYDL